MFYRDLNVTTKGVAVYASEWPLTGVTEVTLTPADDVPVGPIINAGEVMQLLPFGARTQTRDGWYKFLISVFFFLIMNFIDG
ncbi:hypothetical protein LINPERPRIM_LOCUS27068 [Linum perenne]